MIGMVDSRLRGNDTDLSGNDTLLTGQNKIGAVYSCFLDSPFSIHEFLQHFVKDWATTAVHRAAL